MFDKIQSNSSLGYTNGPNRVAGQPEVQSTPRRPINGPAAETSLSENAVLLQRAVQEAHNAPEVRADVVQAIQSKLDAGTYTVNAEALADKLLPILKS